MKFLFWHKGDERNSTVESEPPDQQITLHRGGSEKISDEENMALGVVTSDIK